MSIYTSVLTAGTNSYQETSENINGVRTDFISQGVIGAITNTAGVAPATGAYAVNAQGSPNMTVAVSSGIAYVTATPSSQNSQSLRVRNTASVNVTISANASGSTKYDWIYIKVDATKAANPASDASDVSTLVTSRSSSSATDNGTPPTYGYCIGVVTVANGASSITNGNIADSRALCTNTQKVNSSVLYNPYKFSVYRSAALTPTSGGVLACDTKEFDTGNNVDVVTNKGRFTAPVAGFYYFAAQTRYSSTASVQNFGVTLNKNGSIVKHGSAFVQMYSGATSTVECTVSALLQLSAADYVEAAVFTDGTEALSVASGALDNYFQGYMVSVT